MDFLAITTKAIQTGHLKKILKATVRLQKKNSKYCILRKKRIRVNSLQYFINKQHTRSPLLQTRVVGKGWSLKGLCHNLLSTKETARAMWRRAPKHMLFSQLLLSQVDVSGAVVITPWFKSYCGVEGK